MVVFKINIQSAFARPADKRSGNSQSRAPTGVSALPCRPWKRKPATFISSRLPRYFQQLQDALAFPDMIGADPAPLAGAVDLFKPLVPEAAVHHRFIRPTRKRTIESTKLIRMELASGK